MQSALKAGYGEKIAERTAAKLLMKKSIRDEIKEYSKNICAENPRDLAKWGLSKIAFADVSDCIDSMSNIDSEKENKPIDLFGVSEIKLGKAGTVEIKFADKIKALEALANIPVNDESQEDNSFIKALERGACSLGGISNEE